MTFGIIAKLSSWALTFISNTGYMGIFILSAVESAGIPMSSEVVIPFSGFLVASGRFSLWLVVLVSSVGNLVGSIILFIVGLYGGRWFLEKYGKYFFIDKYGLEAGHRWFKKYGSEAVFLGRVLPAIRTFVSLPAGIAEMDFGKFSIYTFLGSLPWNFALALLGYKIGEKWGVLSGYFKKAEIFILILAVVLIIWWLYKKFYSENK